MYCESFAYMGDDGTHRNWSLKFTTSGRYLTNVKAYMQFGNTATWTDNTSSVYVSNIYGLRCI